MEINRIVRGAAGFVIILSLILAVAYSHWWLLLTLVIGINLFQSAFTNTCPLMWLLRKFGVSEGVDNNKLEVKD